jgi:hypothetical protein
MNTKNNTRGILIGVMLILVIGILSYFYWKVKEETKISEVKVPRRAIQNENTNWATYRNEEYGFEIKYPRSWKIEKAKHLIILTPPEGIFKKTKFFFLRVRQISTPEEALCFPSSLPSGEKILGKVTINGHTVCKMEFKAEEMLEIFYLIIEDGKGFDIGLKADFANSEKEIEEEQRILEQIISSFNLRD